MSSVRLLAMAKKKKKNQPVEARIQIDGLDVVAVPEKTNTETDTLLQQRAAASFVFIPLAKLGKKGDKLARNPKAIAKKKSKLPDQEWHDGELCSLEDRERVPGVLAFDVRRRDARKIAEKLGVNQFLWGAKEAPIEPHDVKVFEEDTERSWSSARAEAFIGLKDMWATAQRHAELPEAVEESQTTIDKFRRLAILVVGAAIAGGAIKAMLIAMLSDTSSSWVSTVANIVFYPFVIPAVIVGVYLRVLMRRAEAQARDFTAGEAAENWTKVSPHLLALWLVCWIAVLLLTLLQTVPSAEIGVFGRTDGVTTSFVVCVWMLLPIAHSQDTESLISSGFEAGISAGVSILMITISLWVTNLISDAILSAIAHILPFVFPEWLQNTLSAIINFGAEVFFVLVLLGYAWSRTRKQFMRL